MGIGARADALGDGDEISDDVAFPDKPAAPPTQTNDDGYRETILPDALKGNMVSEHGESDRDADIEVARLRRGGAHVDEAYIEKMKQADRKGFGEII